MNTNAIPAKMKVSPFRIVIPAKAGIYKKVDSRLRGNDGIS